MTRTRGVFRGRTHRRTCGRAAAATTRRCAQCATRRLGRNRPGCRGPSGGRQAGLSAVTLHHAGGAGREHRCRAAPPWRRWPGPSYSRRRRERHASHSSATRIRRMGGGRGRQQLAWILVRVWPRSAPVTAQCRQPAADESHETLTPDQQEGFVHSDNIKFNEVTHRIP